jgi:hypothetical protein
MLTRGRATRDARATVGTGGATPDLPAERGLEEEGNGSAGSERSFQMEDRELDRSLSDDGERARDGDGSEDEYEDASEVVGTDAPPVAFERAPDAAGKTRSAGAGSEPRRVVPLLRNEGCPTGDAPGQLLARRLEAVLFLSRIGELSWTVLETGDHRQGLDRPNGLNLTSFLRMCRLSRIFRILKRCRLITSGRHAIESRI